MPVHTPEVAVTLLHTLETDHGAPPPTAVGRHCETGRSLDSCPRVRSVSPRIQIFPRNGEKDWGGSGVGALDPTSKGTQDRCDLVWVGRWSGPDVRPGPPSRVGDDTVRDTPCVSPGGPLPATHAHHRRSGREEALRLLK